MERFTKVRVARKSVAHFRIRNREFWNISPERQYFTTEKLRYTRTPFTVYKVRSLIISISSHKRQTIANRGQAE